MKTPFFVGISGGSGSGKTHFLKKLLCAFAPDEICLISQDNYYRPLNQQPIDAQGVENFDLPESIDEAEYTRDLLQLRAGQPVHRLEYTFNNTDKQPAMLTFAPRPIVVVEGLFVFYFRQIAELLDLKIFVDASDVVKIRRRIMRDNLERGYDLDDVLYRYENHVLPSFDKYISPAKRNVDFIIPNHHDNTGMEKALGVIVAYLKAKV
jgi:uridine kinase